MLILTRYGGQAFHIYLESGEIINIKVLDNQLTPYGIVSRIGIDAPRRLNIARTELLRRQGLPIFDDDDEPINDHEDILDDVSSR